uniref:uncharacterized protein LOC122592939 n=1 Tax=Erigeron canadensis TaxID=72917 RepID=UPI001CB8A5E4|nr:uncharacterized protein LOC122592939 [Erigeron canadensis]
MALILVGPTWRSKGSLAPESLSNAKRITKRPKDSFTQKMEGQDIWEVMQGSDVVAPRDNADGALRKWKVKDGKVMFILKTTVEEDLLEHIKDAESPKAAWDKLAELLNKKNDARLQLLENELLGIRQNELTIAQYFHKVKTLCREIGELDEEAAIGDAHKKRIIIHGLRPEFRSFVSAIHGWPTQLSLGEFENLLASQEALAKQMGTLSVGSSSASNSSKNEAEALYADRKKGKGQQGNNYKNFSCDHEKNKSSKEEGNAVAINDEESWDAKAYVAQVVEDVAFAATTECQKNKLDDWIMDSGCSNHMTSDKNRLSKPIKYGGSRVVVLVDNAKYSIQIWAMWHFQEIMENMC